ncbi:hypothetical protein [Tateyamaria sp.]|uniref:hypothetical protein n=1 Tax=Tateyamaria sp. TaxID=1929288 RepID=UPI00329D24DE
MVELQRFDGAHLRIEAHDHRQKAPTVGSALSKELSILKKLANSETKSQVLART